MSFIGYKMTHDSGFAPNPFHGYLTLATCKPSIRRTKRKGDWIAGFASKNLINNCIQNDFPAPPYQGLIYLMRVGEKMPLDEYFEDPRFEVKKPVAQSSSQIIRAGDNIYYLNRANAQPQWSQVPNENHGREPETIEHDVSGINVLLASEELEEFYYFGANALIPEGGWKSIGISMSNGRTFHMSELEVLPRILKWLDGQGFKPGKHGNPCMWEEKLASQQFGCRHK